MSIPIRQIRAVYDDKTIRVYQAYSDAIDHGPREKMKFLFETVEQLNQDEQQVILVLLEGMVMKYQTQRWDSAQVGAK